MSNDAANAPVLAGIDISNLQGPPSSYRATSWYQAAEFVIIQAIEPPAGYPGHNVIDPETGKRGYTGEQLRAAVADGKKVGIYVWLWHGLADTRGNILARLATVPPSVSLDMRPFVDCEDTTGGVMADLEHEALSNPRIHRQLLCEARP